MRAVKGGASLFSGRIHSSSLLTCSLDPISMSTAHKGPLYCPANTYCLLGDTATPPSLTELSGECKMVCSYESSSSFHTASWGPPTPSAELLPQDALKDLFTKLRRPGKAEEGLVWVWVGGGQKWPVETDRIAVLLLCTAFLFNSDAATPYTHLPLFERCLVLGWMDGCLLRKGFL